MAAKFARVPDVPTAEFDDELAVMNLKSGAYITFNRTAAEVWKLLDTPQTLEGLTSVLADRYSVEPARCHSEVDELLTSLVEMGVVERHDR